MDFGAMGGGGGGATLATSVGPVGGLNFAPLVSGQGNSQDQNAESWIPLAVAAGVIIVAVLAFARGK